MLRWPSSAQVLEQARQWAQRQAAGPALATDLPVYSRQEWQALPSWNPKLAVTLARDLHWLIPPPA